MSNIFEQFQGADLDRLAECIKAVRAAGLTIDKYTHTGVNEHSGNVWIASEDWPGCVYCSISFNVQWSYFCPECGDEHDFDTYQALENYASEYDYDRCETCAHETVETETEEN